jgi:hypothetical protein
MVDLAEIQAAYYMVAATGVLVAAVYYVINLKETSINRRIALTNSMLIPLNMTEEGNRRFGELMSMEWKDYNDFYSKYDSTVNLNNFAKRVTVWNTFDAIGYEYRKGVLDAETVYGVLNMSAVNMWLKFKPIIDEYRKTDYGRDMYVNFEYLAGEMARMKAERDASWKGSPSYIKSGEYDRTFKK